MKPMRILIVGDSHAKCRLPHGSVDSDAIANRLDVPDELRLAVSGSTAIEWASDKDGWLSRAQALAAECDAVLISLLGNDLFAAARDGHIETSEVAAAAGALYEVVRSIAIAAPRTFVLLYGYPYHDSNVRNILALEALDGAIEAVVETVRVVTGSRIETIDERRIVSRSDWPGDDIHPLESGYIAIADEVARRMEPK